MVNLRLILRRSKILSLNYDETTGALASELSCDIVSSICAATQDPAWSSSDFLRCHAPTVVFSPIVILATLLIRQRGHVCHAVELAFRQAAQLIWDMAKECIVGGYVEAQLAEVIRIASDLLNETSSSEHQVSDTNAVALADLFSTELQNMAAYGSFPETGDSLEWLEGLGATGAATELNWNSLFMGLE
jgi:hypothetical protein